MYVHIRTHRYVQTYFTLLMYMQQKNGMMMRLSSPSNPNGLFRYYTLSHIFSSNRARLKKKLCRSRPRFSNSQKKITNIIAIYGRYTRAKYWSFYVYTYKNNHDKKYKTLMITLMKHLETQDTHTVRKKLVHVLFLILFSRNQKSHLFFLFYFF